MQDKKDIYTLMSKIMSEVGPVAKTAIAGGGLKYKFRAIDDIYAALQSVLANNGVFFIPFVQKVTREQRDNNTTTLVEVEFRFFAPDGSSVVALTTGEGMDQWDKSANKAMTSALKNCLVQVFCIPTADSSDSEYDNPEPNGKHEVVLVSCTACGVVACMPNKFGSGFYCNPKHGGCGKKHEQLTGIA
jgi:hypothetical protein